MSKLFDVFRTTTFDEIISVSVSGNRYTQIGFEGEYSDAKCSYYFKPRGSLQYTAARYAVVRLFVDIVSFYTRRNPHNVDKLRNLSWIIK